MGAVERGREFFVARRKRPAQVGGLYVATGSSIHHRPVVDRCVIPTESGPCGHVLFEGEDRARFDRHVRDCAQRNHEHIVEYLEHKHPAIMEPWDTELDRWISKHRDELLEGRKRI